MTEEQCYRKTLERLIFTLEGDAEDLKRDGLKTGKINPFIAGQIFYGAKIWEFLKTEEMLWKSDSK